MEETKPVFKLDDEQDARAPPLDEWDFKSLPKHFFLVLEGKRRTGKSTFTKWLLQYYADRFSLVIAMTKTMCSGFYPNLVGTKWCYDRYTPEVIRKIIERNDKVIAKYGEESPEADEASTLIILDDVIEPDIFYDDMFVTLAVEGRHHLLSIVFCTQDPKAVSPKVRDNADVAVVFNQKTFRNKESIWHDFMNDTDKNTAYGLLAKYAVEHNCLVCVQTNLNSDIKKNFFKSTGDKTKLENPNYLLGDDYQRRAIEEERAQSEQKRKENEARHRLDGSDDEDEDDEDDDESSSSDDDHKKRKRRHKKKCRTTTTAAQLREIFGPL
jgi:hypothetical protein